MVGRIIFGNLGSGEFGIRVSKPGDDVMLIAPGDAMFDSNQLVFQKIASARTTIAYNQPAGNYTVSALLPAEFASYSNLHMWSNVIYREVGTGYASGYPTYDTTTSLNNFTNNFNFRVDSGSAIFNYVTTPDTTIEITVVSGSVKEVIEKYVYVDWVVFNARIN